MIRIRRYSLRTETNPAKLERLRSSLYGRPTRALGDFINQCLEDQQRPQSKEQAITLLDSLSSLGDWYCVSTPEDESTAQGVAFISGHGSRTGRLMLANIDDAETLQSICADSFNRSGFRKIKTETRWMNVECLQAAGFQVTGESPADGLFDGHWVAIFSLEILNPQWADDAGAEVRHVIQRRGSSRERWYVRVWRRWFGRIADAARSICGY